MRYQGRTALAVAVLAFVVAGCGGGGSAKEKRIAGTATGAKLTLHKSEFGKVLFAGSGNVLYMFGPDKAGRSACYGVCARAWPPLLTKGTPTVTGLNAELLGTTTRRDGAVQVTYNRHPLYFYSGDKHGKIMCQHAVMHGGIWLVLKPNGTPSKAKGKMMEG
jgi:predicted lipoprotein with Yx(FWY)xxD motif